MGEGLGFTIVISGIGAFVTTWTVIELGSPFTRPPSSTATAATVNAGEIHPPASPPETDIREYGMSVVPFWYPPEVEIPTFQPPPGGGEEQGCLRLMSQFLKENVTSVIPAGGTRSPAATVNSSIPDSASHCTEGPSKRELAGPVIGI